MSSEPYNPFSKEATLARSPGGNRKARAKKAENTKGQRLEKTVAEKLGGRVNNQRQWGSVSNPDVSAGLFDIETKSGPVSIRAEIDEQVKKTAFPRKPGLVFDHKAEQWITVRLDDHVAFAKYVADKEGYYMVPAGDES